MDNVSYALGMNIGRQLQSIAGDELVIEDFSQAIKDIFAGNSLLLDETEAEQVVTTYIRAKEQKKSHTAKADGEAFLAANGTKPEVITLPSGLQYQVLQQGTGKKPQVTDKVRCHYEGTLIDGIVFDSSIRRSEPATFPLNGVIAGWTEGLQLMGEGDKFRFFIPYQLAYGSAGAGASIPPYAALIFDVELLAIV